MLLKPVSIYASALKLNSWTIKLASISTLTDTPYYLMASAICTNNSPSNINKTICLVIKSLHIQGYANEINRPITILFDSNLRSSQVCEWESNVSILCLIPNNPSWGIQAQFARCHHNEYYNKHSK